MLMLLLISTEPLTDWTARAAVGLISGQYPDLFASTHARALTRIQPQYRYSIAKHSTTALFYRSLLLDQSTSKWHSTPCFLDKPEAVQITLSVLQG